VGRERAGIASGTGSIWSDVDIGRASEMRLGGTMQRRSCGEAYMTRCVRGGREEGRGRGRNVGRWRRIRSLVRWNEFFLQLN